MKDTDLAWMAGLLEGEGCFTIYEGAFRRTHNKRGVLVVNLTMTDRDVVNRMAALVKSLTGSTTQVRKYVPKRENRQVLWVYAVNGERAAAVMRAVLPYMGTRRTQRINELLARTDASHVRKAAA